MGQAKLELIFSNVRIDKQQLGTISDSTKRLIKKNQEKLYEEYLKECTTLSFKEWILQGGC
jgi:hypothetical protein